MSLNILLHILFSVYIENNIWKEKSGINREGHGTILLFLMQSKE